MTTRLTRRGDRDDPADWESFLYIVTDIECDGPEPGRNSMRSFASVAVDQAGAIAGQFEVRLKPLEGAAPDPGTLGFLQSHPEAWADLQRDPRPAADAMASYVQWIRDLPARAVFAAHPLAFDGLWIDWYLRRFAGLRLVCGPYGGEELFLGAGLDLPSLLMGVEGWPLGKCRRELYPAEWSGGHAHSHRAIDDALGYAHVLGTALRRRAGR